MQELLDQAQLLGSSHERRFHRLGTTGPSSLADDPDRPPCGDRLVPPLQGEWADLSEGDGVRRGSIGRLAHEHRPRLRLGLEPRCGVHEVPGHDTLRHGADRDGGFSRQDAGAREQLDVHRPAERFHPVYEL